MKNMKMKKYDEEMDNEVRGGVLDEMVGDMDDMMYEQKLKPILSINISAPVGEPEKMDEENEDMDEEMEEEEEE